jgi:hypothetical protein
MAMRLPKTMSGQDLPGVEEARAAALVSAREILADSVKPGAKNPLQSVIITNESGQEIITIPARDVLPEPLKR